MSTRKKIKFRVNGGNGYINLERLTEVTEQVLDFMHARNPPFDKMDFLPDAVIPTGFEPGSFDHASHILLSCQQDSRRKSQLVYEDIRKFWEKGILDIRAIHAYTLGHLESVFAEHFREKGSGSAGTSAELWYHNSMKLYMGYRADNLNCGDPRKLKGKDIPKSIKILQQFKGIGPGIAALIAKNYVKFGIWDFPAYTVLPKIDRHIKRIALSTGIIELPKGTEVVRESILSPPLTQGFSIILHREKWSGIDTDDGYWGLGSYVCFQNSLSACRAAQCPVGCTNRPKLDKQATIYSMIEDTRGDHPLLDLGIQS